MRLQQRFRKKDSWVVWTLLTLYTLYMFYSSLFESALAEITFLKQGTMRSLWMWPWIHNMYIEMLVSGEFIFSPNAWINVGNLFQLDVSLCSMCSFMLWQCCVYSLVRFRHTNHLVGDGKQLWFCFTRFSCHRYLVLVKLSQCLIKNIKFCCA